MRKRIVDKQARRATGSLLVEIVEAIGAAHHGRISNPVSDAEAWTEVELLHLQNAGRDSILPRNAQASGARLNKV